MTLIVPDIHADLERLEAALSLAGEDRIAFLGDFIDHGKWSQTPPADGAVLERVRRLIEDGRAVAVMGNHEINAILFHRSGPDGQPLRPHSAKNIKQHKSFVDEFGVMSERARRWTDWFLSTLPLWREEDGFRLVHACWSEEAIGIVRARRPDGYLLEEDLPEVAAENTPFGRAVKRIVSGPEATLPAGYYIVDSKDVRRREVRLRWWGSADTWKTSALSVTEASRLPGGPLPAETAVDQYDPSLPPVFIGHYKMEGHPLVEDGKVLCLDYPKAPCVYRFLGETCLRQDNLWSAVGSRAPLTV